MKVGRYGVICLSISFLLFAVAFLPIVNSAESIEVIKLGVINCESGRYATYGKPAADGPRLAMKELEAKGPFKVAGKLYRLELVERESRTEEAVAVAAALEMIRDLKIKFITGAMGITCAPVAQLCVKNRVLYWGTGTSLVPFLGKPGFDLSFLMVPRSDLKAKLCLGAINHFWPTDKKIAFIAADDATTHVMLPAAQEELAKYGMTQVVKEQVFTPGATDFSAYLTRIKAAKPDVIYTIIGGTEELIGVLRQGVELDSAPHYMMYCTIPDVPMKFAFGKPAPVPVITASAGISLYPAITPYTKDLLKRYLDYLGTKEPPDKVDALTWWYDVPGLLIAGMKKAGTVDDVDAIAKAIREIEYVGGIGPFSFDKDNAILSGLDVCLTEKGKMTPKTMYWKK